MFSGTAQTCIHTSTRMCLFVEMDCSYWTASPSCIWRNCGREHQNTKDGGGGGRQGYFEVKSRMRDGMGITEMKSRPLKPGVWSCSLPGINSSSYRYVRVWNCICIAKDEFGDDNQQQRQELRGLLCWPCLQFQSLYVLIQSNRCLAGSTWTVSLIAKALLSCFKGKRKLECFACFIRLSKSWVHSL